MDRRTFVKSGTALSGLAAFGAFDQARAQGTGPIRIGLLTPLTGVVASGGKEIAEGFNLFNRFNQAASSPLFTDVNAFAQRDGGGRYFSRSTSAFDPRQFQFALKLYF